MNSRFERVDRCDGREAEFSEHHSLPWQFLPQSQFYSSLLAGLKERFPAQALNIAAVTNKPQEARLGTCFITQRYDFKSSYRPDICLKLDAAKKNYLLLGDSHSAVLWYGLQSQMPGVNVMQASMAGCNPIYGKPKRNDCGRMVDYIFNDFLSSHKIDGLFLTARWANDAEFTKLASTIDWCRQHNLPVYIFGPVVEYDAPLPRLIAYSIAFKDPEIVEQHMRREFFGMDAYMKQEAKEVWRVNYLSIVDAACPNEKCLHYADAEEKIAFLGDDDHFSTAGSELIVRRFEASGQLPPPL